MNVEFLKEIEKLQSQHLEICKIGLQEGLEKEAWSLRIEDAKRDLQITRAKISGRKMNLLKQAVAVAHHNINVLPHDENTSEAVSNALAEVVRLAIYSE